jgi:hypothetical protein
MCGSNRLGLSFCFFLVKQKEITKQLKSLLHFFGQARQKSSGLLSEPVRQK